MDDITAVVAKHHQLTKELSAQSAKQAARAKRSVAECQQYIAATKEALHRSLKVLQLNSIGRGF